MRDRVRTSSVSTANWSEVVQKAIAHGVDVTGLRENVEALGVTLVPVDAALAEDAAGLWPRTRAAGLSLGDRLCLALAVRLGQPALTTDRAWAAVADAVPVAVETIR